MSMLTVSRKWSWADCVTCPGGLCLPRTCNLIVKPGDPSSGAVLLLGLMLGWTPGPPSPRTCLNLASSFRLSPTAPQRPDVVYGGPGQWPPRDTPCDLSVMSLKLSSLLKIKIIFISDLFSETLFRHRGGQYLYIS